MCRELYDEHKIYKFDFSKSKAAYVVDEINYTGLYLTPHKGDVENFRHFMSLIDHDIFSNVSAGETLKDKSKQCSSNELPLSPIMYRWCTKKVKHGIRY